MKRASLVVLAVLIAGWVAYDRAWRHGGAHPIVFRTELLRGFETNRPFVRVTKTGNVERVLIAAGPRSSTGYSIEIRRIVEERGRVAITVRERDEPGRAEITYPYRLLVFRTIDKPVHVHWEGR